MDNNGRPEYPEDQYQKWLDELAPFFKLGETLNSAIDDAGLQKHRTTIYEKVRLGDWFSDKMETLQAIPGKLANNILVKRVMLVDEKIKQGLPITEEEMRDVRFIAEKHRSSQPYFVNRQEVAQSDPFKIEKLLDELEDNNKAEYNNLAEQARKELERQTQTVSQI
jgi:hypothetical protein